MRASVRSFLYLSVAWLLVLAATAWLFYPSIDQIAFSIDPNPFWSLQASGNPAAPFVVMLKTLNWVLLSVVPIVLVGLLMALSWRAQRAPASDAH